MALHRVSRRLTLAGLAAFVGFPAVGQQKRPGDWAAKVLAAPGAIHPIEYADLVGVLWDRGDKAQATFWFYIFQARTLPWAKAEPPGGGLGAVRAVVNQNVGARINGWVAADLEVWKSLGQRAIDYEPKFPLFASRPDGMSESRWTTLVTECRAEYRDGFRQFTASVTAEDLARQRRGNGLYVGALNDQGAPLPASWR